MRHVLSSTAALLAALAGTVPAQTPARSHQAAIENALSAAPPSVRAGATVVDHQQKVLRQGGNGWTCMADMPDVPNNSPMCLDATWLRWMDAFVNKREPQVTQLGVAYMLQGDMPVSNVDPFAAGPTADNQWVENAGPHIMLVLPDASLLEGLPTDPGNGGPWVMWKGTPYAHVMVPAPRPAN